MLIFQTDFLRKFWDCSGAKVCKSCRAWKMLSNAYFLAKFRFDTAENEPAKNLQKNSKNAFFENAFFGASGQPTSVSLTPRRHLSGTSAASGTKILVVFGCIGTDFCKKICVLQHFSKSTRLSSWNFWNLIKFCKFCDICNFVAEISRTLLFF